MTLITIAKKVIRGIKIETLALSDDNKYVKELKKTERKFKRAYKLDTRVVYIDVKHKELITDPNNRGLYNRGAKCAIVFIDGNLERNKRTLLHELTHGYQDRYMHKKYIASVIALKEKKVKYEDSWHEEHARHCADLLMNCNVYNINLKDAFNYIVAA